MSTNEVKKISLPGKPALFLISMVLITLTVSFPLFSLLLFAVFPSTFALIAGEKILKQIILLFSLVFTVCLIVFINDFFIRNHPLLFLLAALYFSALLGLDIFITFHALNHQYALFLVFSYIIISRFILHMSTSLFPFYWTLTMHLLPFMGVISRFVFPLFFEAFCVSFASMLYVPSVRKPINHYAGQLIAILFGVMVLSGIAQWSFGSYSYKPGLECTLVQGGYSRHDYVLIERYPVIGLKMAQKYLGHIQEVTQARFLLLPESAFPVRQIEDSEILQVIKDTARERNEYIMTGILLEESEKVYNASVLIDPEGRLQNIYRKRNTVLFVESSTFTPGVMANTFSVDGHIIAPVICYESLFIRNYFRDKRPELYIVISNDIFAEKTILSRLHQAYGVINSRTLRTPLLQAMQNGPSSYVDSQCVLTNLTKPYEKVIGLPVTIK
jgi:apolipoprotein N-acyltransferase